MNNRYKILLVEDDRNIEALLSALFESSGYQMLTAGSCSAGILMAASHVPDLIVLDLGLPDKDGMELLRTVRETSLVPVIVLSARSDEAEKVRALDNGANDYVTKPFGSAELLARVRSALRNSRRGLEVGGGNDGVFVSGDLTIDYDARTVRIGDRDIHFTQTEYNIVSLLARHCGKMMTYSAIVRAVWGIPDEGSVKKLQVNMANIRRKMGITPGQDSYIVNELGVGYRMRELSD